MYLHESFALKRTEIIEKMSQMEKFLKMINCPIVMSTAEVKIDNFSIISRLKQSTLVQKSGGGGRKSTR